MKHALKSVTLAAALTLSALPAAQAAFIGFDDLASGTSLTNQYASLGVVFSGFENGTEIAPEVRAQEFISVPASSPNYLTNFFNFPSTAGDDRLDEIRISFLAPTTDVTMVINTAGTNDIRFDIYDFSGAFVESVVRSGSGTDNVSISIAGSNIGRISAFQPTDLWWWSLDDLSFTQASVPVPGTLALMLLGMAGLGLARRHRAA